MRRICWFGLTLAILGLVGLGKNSPAIELAEFVPQESAIYIELTDPVRILDRLLAPDVVDMLNSVEQFRQFKQSGPYDQLLAVVSVVEQRLGQGWHEALRGLVSGGVVLAVQPGSPQCNLLEIRAKDAQTLDRLNRLLIEFAEGAARKRSAESPVKSREFKGVQAWSIGKGDFHAIIDNTLVFSDKQECLKAVLEMNAGEGVSSIARLGTWREARSRLPKDAVGWAFARWDIFRQAGFAKDLYSAKASHPAMPVFFGGLAHVMSEAPYASAALTLNEECIGLQAQVPRSAKDWPEAFQGFYASQQGQEAAEPLQPPRTIASLSFYRDFRAIWDARDQLVRPEVLPGFTALESNLGQVLFGKREFSTEVLGEVGPHIRLVVTEQDYSSLEMSPVIKLPAMALVLELKNPERFGQELRVAYQTVVGLINLGLGRQNQPRFIQSTEKYKGHEIQTARYLLPPAAETSSAVRLQYNFSPSCATAGRYFVVGSTVEVVKDLIDTLGDVDAPPKTTKHNVILKANAIQIVSILDQNKETLIQQNMVENGHTREQAEQDFGNLMNLLNLFGEGRFTWTADQKTLSVDMQIDFAARDADGK